MVQYGKIAKNYNGYTFYEYLECDNRSWIDTKVTLSDTLEIKIKATEDTGTNTSSVIGTDSWSTGFMSLYHYCPSNVRQGWYATYVAGYYSMNEMITGKTVVDYNLQVDFANGTASHYFDGQLKRSVTFEPKTYSKTSTIKIFKGNGIQCTDVKVYYAKIYIDGELVRDLIPASNGTEYGFYDLKNDVFYKNEGTGTFTVSQNNADVDIMADIKNVMTPSLDAYNGYTFYEYLQGDGQAYINTNIADDLTFEITAKYQNVQSSNYNMIFSSNVGYGAEGMRFFSLGGTIYCGYGATRLQNNVSIPYDEILTVEYSHKSPITITGSTVYTLQNAIGNTNGTTLKFFKDAAYSYGSLNKLFSATVKKGGSVILKLVPAKNSNGEAGLYDFVGNVFYRNSGTGAFSVSSRKLSLDEIEGVGEYIQNDKISLVEVDRIVKYGKYNVFDPFGREAANCLDFRVSGTGPTAVFNEPDYSKIYWTFASNGHHQYINPAVHDHYTDNSFYFYFKDGKLYEGNNSTGTNWYWPAFPLKLEKGKTYTFSTKCKFLKGGNSNGTCDVVAVSYNSNGVWDNQMSPNAMTRNGDIISVTFTVPDTFAWGLAFIRCAYVGNEVEFSEIQICEGTEVKPYEKAKNLLWENHLLMTDESEYTYITFDDESTIKLK